MTATARHPLTDPRPKMHRNRRGGVLTYEGVAYVRPVQRGIIVGNIDTQPDAPYLDDLIERLIGDHGDCYLELTVRAVSRSSR